LQGKEAASAVPKIYAQDVTYNYEPVKHVMMMLKGFQPNPGTYQNALNKLDIMAGYGLSGTAENQIPENEGMTSWAALEGKAWGNQVLGKI